MTVGRKVSETCLKLIKEFEGCRLKAYPDPGTGDKPWTIGWGSTGPGIKKGVVWTQAQADARFAEDVRAFAKQVDEVLGSAETTKNQFSALVSFAYNVGITALKYSTLLRLHRQKKYAEAAKQFLRWNKAGGTVMRGLTNRRKTEADLYSKPDER